jgi:hypothetical protein
MFSCNFDSFNEIAVAINSALSLDRILESIVQKCTKHLHVEQVAVLLLKRGTVRGEKGGRCVGMWE